MAHLYRLFKSILFSVIVTVGVLTPAIAQVGFNNPNPDSTALIDMKANDKGLLVPRMTTVDRTNMTLNGKKPANSLLVFDTNQKMFFFYDTVTVPNRWVAMNPWASQGTTSPDIITSTTGNVGIGTTAAPTAKLEVNGNIKSTGNVNTTGNVTAGAATITGNVNSGTINSGAITSTSTVTATTFVGNGTIPVGGIIMWQGTPSTIPTGWRLCDGTFGTPNLQNRFILSYGNTTGNPGTTGGQDNITLTAENLPPHKHDFTDRYANPASVATGSTRTRASDDTTQGGTLSNSETKRWRPSPI